MGDKTKPYIIGGGVHYTVKDGAETETHIEVIMSDGSKTVTPIKPMLCKRCEMRKTADLKWEEGDRMASESWHEMARRTPHAPGCPKTEPFVATSGTGGSIPTHGTRPVSPPQVVVIGELRREYHDGIDDGQCHYEVDGLNDAFRKAEAASGEDVPRVRVTIEVLPSPPLPTKE